MLATPLLVGILASHPAWVHVPLAATWFLGYFAFFAAGLWLKAPPRRRPRLVKPTLTYAAATTAAGALTLALDPGLLRWAPWFILPLGVGLVASKLRDDRSLWSGVSTSAGSCLMTVVAYDAGGGTDLHRAWLLAGILAAYFVGTVLYVKTMIRERGDERYLWLSILGHGAATCAMIPIDPALVVVFTLLTIRAAILPAFRLSPKAVGIAEIVATLAVALTALGVT